MRFLRNNHAVFTIEDLKHAVLTDMPCFTKERNGWHGWRFVGIKEDLIELYDWDTKESYSTYEIIIDVHIWRRWAAKYIFSLHPNAVFIRKNRTTNETLLGIRIEGTIYNIPINIPNLWPEKSDDEIMIIKRELEQLEDF